MEVAIIEKENALLALRIMTALQRHGMSVYQLAQQTHVTLSTIQRICAGEATNPSVWSIAAIAEVLGVSIDYLVRGYRDVPAQED